MPGTTDTVKAILTPGEFVIRKEAVDMIGVPTLEKLNDMPEAGGHSEIDRLIAQATLKNMTGMYGGGMVNAKQYMGGGMVDMYGHGGKVKSQMMMGYEHGGEAHGNLKPVPNNNPGLAKLPENVRNKMGYMQDGGSVDSIYNLNKLKKLMPMKASNLMGTFDEDQAKVVRKIISGLDISDEERSMLTPKMEKPMGLPTEIQSELLRKIISGDSLSTEEQQNFTPKMSPLGMQEGGEVEDSLMGMMYGGKAKKKKEMYGYQDGGQAYSQTLYNTPLENSFAQELEPGLFDVGSILSISADQVGGEGDRRYYLGEGQSKMLNMARKKAAMRARQKMASAPQDSIPAALVESYFEQAPEEEKGGFLKKLLGMQDGGAVQEDAMMQQYLQSLMAQQPQANPFVPFDQRPPSSGEVMSPIPSGMEQGDYYRSLRGELEMENEELIRDKAQNALERIKLDSLLMQGADSLLNQGAERIERVPNDSSYFQNTPAQDNFMQKFKENMLNPTYFPEGN